MMLLGAVVVGSFAYAGYLLTMQVRPISPSELRASATPGRMQSVPDLIKDAGQRLERHEVEQALVDYRQALSLDPKSLEAQIGVARGEYLAGREETSAREYEKALRLDPGNTTALIQTAKIYSHLPRTWQRSEALFRKYLTLKPDDAEAQLELARILAWSGKSQDAVELFSKEAVSHAMSYNDQRTYAFALVKAGRADEAQLLLSRMIAAHPDDWEIKLQLADMYARRKDWSSALPIYKQVMAARPHDARVALACGLAFLSEHRYQAAVPPLATACRTDPSSREAGLAYARALRGAGNQKSAAKEFGRIAPMYRNSPEVLREYADLLIERHDYKRSEKYYRAAYASGLRDERLLMGLAGSLRGRGRDREALPYLEEAYKLHPSNRLAFELAQIYRKVGEYDRALAMLNKIGKRS